MSAASGRPALPVVCVAGRPIGASWPAWIVAEAGVNHDGCVEKALRLVDAACEAGADAVKFQIFRADELATAAAPGAAYQRCDDGSQRAMLSRLELGDDAFARIRRQCDERRIVFLATPFGRPDLARLLRLNPPAIKLASTDIDNVPLLRAAAGTGLPLIVSTGAATAAEISDAVEHLGEFGALHRSILLRCVSQYPAPLHDVNLRAIRSLAATYDVPVGFSDHTLSVEVGAWAVAAGACVLEKHLTLDRTADGPDHAMSLNPEEFRTYVRQVRALESALGDGAIGMTDGEIDVRRVARKSVVASRALPAGTLLTPDVLAIKRPSGGISPAQFDQLAGRRLATPVAADTPLTWEMLQ
ncbi:MAG: N,N'-diacetyllegionaminic acid synthase [Phycisphaerae bacterium]|nr:N,N'-diacetyllegionaminic acid synthase [Phycisphaerae bacterium]